MSLRSWATPLTIGAFLLISVTGILMFFHLETGLSKAAHEWLGWFLVAGVAAHLWLNWRPFTTYFKRPLARVIIGAGAAVLVASLVVPAGEAEVPVRQALGSLTHAPIATLATLAGKEEASLLAALATDHPGATSDQSLADLTGNDPEAAVHLLSRVYATTPAE
jgi:L-alanine-DL-glutamate epimerase-like enolase superfamily enzyme